MIELEPVTHHKTKIIYSNKNRAQERSLVQARPPQKTNLRTGGPHPKNNKIPNPHTIIQRATRPHTSHAQTHAQSLGNRIQNRPEKSRTSPHARKQESSKMAKKQKTHTSIWALIHKHTTILQNRNMKITAGLEESDGALSII